MLRCRRRAIAELPEPAGDFSCRSISEGYQVTRLNSLENLGKTGYRRCQKLRRCVKDRHNVNMRRLSGSSTIGHERNHQVLGSVSIKIYDSHRMVHRGVIGVIETRDPPFHKSW